MADQEDGQKQMQDVVSEITVKALKEFSSGSFNPDGTPKGSRAGSVAGSGAGSPAGSTKGSRPPSASKTSKPGSASGSRPTSATKDHRPESAAGSRPTSAAKGERAESAAGSRPTSAAKSERAESAAGSRPTSAAKDQRPGTASGSRPTSAAKETSRPASAVKSPSGSRPTSAAKETSRPGSRARDSRPTSAAKTSPKPDDREEGLVVSGSRPQSARDVQSPTADRPESGRPGSGRPGSGRPGSGRPGSDRPGSGRPGSDRPGSGRPGSDRPGSGRPGSGRPGSSRPRSAQQDTYPVTEEPQEDEDGGEQWHRGAPQEEDRHDEPPSEAEPSGPQDLQYTDLMQPLGAAGGDGGDSGEDEDDMGDMEEEEDDDSDGESEMVVLDPDHPLMQRFQKALKGHLEKQNGKVTLELRELLEAVKNKKLSRENVGVELYGVQQELARHQMMLEKKHDDFSQVKETRTQTEQELHDVRDQYKQRQQQTNEERRRGAELQGEVENLALRLFYMDNAKEDVRSDIAVMKRAAEKAETEVTKAETEKQKQDLYVDRLVERVDKLREDIALCEAQLTAQSEETKAAKEALTEAHMEIDAIDMEKKQLFQQWNSSLIGMRRRDEAHSAMQEALHQQQQRILSLETEIEGFKKSISKEQEQNEKLTLILAKTEQDIATVKKMLANCQAKHEALKNEYATYTRMLHETEQALNRANTDKTLRANEVNALRKQIEREYQEKVRLEDEIIEKLRGQMTLEKAADYTDKLTKKNRLHTRDMDQQVAQVENDISKDTLEVSYTKTRIERLKKILTELDAEIQQKNEIISKSEAEMTKRNAVIERKQGVIDQYNKKLELMITQAGGVELGPLEIQINSIQKSIEAEQAEITELQQMWLRDQNELVKLSQEKEQKSHDVVNLRKQLTILTQKKIRIEADIDSQKCETGDIQRNIRNMENEMLKLNMLFHKEIGMEHQLNQGNVLMENDFIGNLKEAEMGSIKMQSKLDEMMEEKERLLNSLIEAERQIMLWEKKTQLAKETRNAVDSEVGQGEMAAMKSEIHRMEVRYTQLMKQQERMIQEMEKAVSRRDTIVTRGDAQAKSNKKVLTKGTFQRQMNETKKKIKTTIQDANSCDEEIHELRTHQQEMGSQLEEKQLNVQQLQSNADTLDGDVDRLMEIKHKNMADLVARQQKSKYYQQVKDNKYVRLCRTDTALDNELQKQVDRMQAVNAIVDRLNQEFPHVQGVLRKVLLVYGSRAHGTDGED